MDSPEHSEADSSSLDLISFSQEQQRLNPWIDKVRGKGINLTIPPRFFRNDLPEQTHIDPLTGLPIEEDGMRIRVASELSNVLRLGTSWALIYADADNLKSANTKYDREFGDTVILESSSRITSAISQLNLPDSVQIFVTRQTGAADETVTWIFGATSEQMAQIRQAMAQAQEVKQMQDPDFSLSTSIAMLTSEDPALEGNVTAAKEYLAKDPRNVAFDIFNELKQLADDEVKLIKIRRDIERIPVERLIGASGREEVNKILNEQLGDTRIGKLAFQAVLEIEHFETILELYEEFDPGRRNEILEKRNYSDEIKAAFQSDNPRLTYYTSILPKAA